MGFKKIPINKEGRTSNMKVSDFRVGDEVVIYSRVSQNADNPIEIIVPIQDISKGTEEVQVRTEQGFSVYVKCFDVLRIQTKGKNW